LDRQALTRASGYHVLMKPMTVDPRAWNIAAGLCLASGCGSRVVGADASGTGEASESSTTLDSTDASSSEGPECVTDADCPPGIGYYCLNGFCEYVVGDGYAEIPDGYGEGPYNDCYADADCDPLETCEFVYCQGVGTPVACRPPDPVPSLTIPEAALALSFADVDDDGAEELVVATQSELQVYEHGVDIPLVSPRGLDSDSIDAMDAAHFDAMPGEDLVILFADELRLHASDGVGNFAAPSVSPSNWPDSVGLLAGELDGAPLADMLIWASSGAGLELGNGDLVPVSVDVVIGAATARSISEPVAGFVLQRDGFLEFYISGVDESVGVSQLRGVAPHALTSIAELGDSFDLSSSRIDSSTAWTIIEQWGAVTGSLGARWGVLGHVTAMAGGEFDGDARADVALIVDGTVQVQFGALTETTCLAFYPFAGVATNLAVGDHDGDADDEIAIRFEGGNVAVIDAE
jgi:hypothetical protein